MAKVPVYSEPQTELRPLPAVRQDSVASPSLFSAGAEKNLAAGKQIIAAGEDFNKIAVQMAERENADMVFRAENALKTEYIGFQNAARERRGAAAKDLTKESADWWDKKIGEHSGNLSNPRQREIFTKRASGLRLQSVEGMSAYESEQRRISLNESTTASITSSIDLAASQVGTPTERNAIMGARADIIKQLDVLAKLNGYDGNTAEATALRDAKRATALTNLHMQVIQNIANGQNGGERAKAYFEANKTEINGTNYDAIEKLWKTGMTKEKAQETAKALAAMGETEASGLTWIRENLKGDEQEAASLEWRTRHAEMEAATRRMQSNYGDKAWDIYNKTGRYSAIPVDVLNGMDPKAREQLKTHAQEKAKGREVKTDFATWYDLQQKIIAGEPVDLKQYAAQISTGDLKGLATLQSKPEPELKDAATLQQQLAAEHNNLGWGNTESDRQKKGAFDKAVGDAINAEQNRTGKKLNYEERQKIIDRMLIQGEVLTGKWYMNDPDKRYYETTPAERKAFKANIPPAQTKQIIEALKARGKPVTDEAIIDLYNAAKRRGEIK